jgi:3-oxoacyl-[acyl-carrier protein] reductase
VAVDSDIGLAAVGVVSDLTVDGAADSLVRSALDRLGVLGRVGVVRCGIAVNIVAPEYISTGSQLPFEAEVAGPIGCSGAPAEIAACVPFLANESASFTTGAVLVADGGHGLPETNRNRVAERSEQKLDELS